MKDPIIDRPKVSMVKVTVKSSHPGSDLCYTEIEFTTVENIVSFPFWPILKLNPPYSIDSDHERELPDPPNNIIIYRINGKTIDRPNVDNVDVDLERNGVLINATFSYDNQSLC